MARFLSIVSLILFTGLTAPAATKFLNIVIDPTPVPEPATIALLGAGLAGLALLSLRRKQ